MSRLLKAITVAAPGTAIFSSVDCGQLVAAPVSVRRGAVMFPASFYKSTAATRQAKGETMSTVSLYGYWLYPCGVYGMTPLSSDFNTFAFSLRYKNEH